MCTLNIPVYLKSTELYTEVSMVNQGRLVKVMFMLMAAMTTGALVLLALEGKPIKPMPFSLSSQTQLRSTHYALGTQAGIELGRWQRVKVCYQSSLAQFTTQSNGPTGTLATDYHFVISNGTASQDGRIYATSRWTKQLACLGTDGTDLSMRTIRICLISDTDPPSCSAQQYKQLNELADGLIKHCRIRAGIVWEKY